MRSKLIIAVIIASVVLLCGCIGQTPPADGSASGDNDSGGLASPVVLNTYSGAVLSLKDVVEADCDSGVDCIGILLEVENPTDSAVTVDPWMTGKERIVDSSGKEYSLEKCALLEKIDLKNSLMPGAKREGYFCFKNTGSDSKIFFGFNDSKSNTASFSIPLSSVRTPAKSIEMQMSGDNYKYACGEFDKEAVEFIFCLSEVYGTVKNTGEAPVRVKLLQPNINKGEAFVDVMPGETKNFSVGKAAQRSTTGGYYHGNGCLHEGNIRQEGGIVWATAYDAFNGAEFDKKGIEVSDCGYYTSETYKDTVYSPYLGDYEVTKVRYPPKPCCPNGFCAAGSCVNGMCIVPGGGGY